ncbi:uncharacterized protein G2W53_031092 [Senna tora]|uniref:Uncharacterized protein n=1 Tax=Senna tora TaxID=362788 RepID=A0A834T8B5_9FABA|nr:uncharacterized protein G2W53_031092 [Senna tora]
MEYIEVESGGGKTNKGSDDHGWHFFSTR